MTVKKGQEVDLTIESLAYGGKGIARIDDFVIFVKNAIPGQKVRAPQSGLLGSICPWTQSRPPCRCR